ncbi:MAG: radical SAM protein [Candidatus Omnitrophota bacterium]
MEIKLIQTQKVLCPTQISIADYVINPYRGCGFKCLYCYSRENKNIKNGYDRGRLGVKENSPQILQRELRYTRPKRVLLGSVTECFQEAELKYKVTEKVLNILNEYSIPYTILTKSHYITRCLSLISKNKKNKIYFTLSPFPGDTLRLFEKKSPAVLERIKAIEDILRAGIDLRLHLGPFIPFVSDLDYSFGLIPKKAKEIEIELYHNTMGNFNKILSIVRKNLRCECAGNLESVYSSRESYLKYSENLKGHALKKVKGKDIKLFYIVPDFNDYYSSRIDYGAEIK